MTEDYKDFLNWATPQLTLNQYRKLARVIHSFKKYKLITDQATSMLCRFKDDSVYVFTHFPHFFTDMASLARLQINDFFKAWYNDNVIFWPYRENPVLVKARKRLMEKCETHVTHYRFLYIFREDKHGEIILFKVVNKGFAGSPLHEHSLERYIYSLWRMYSFNKNVDNIKETSAKEYNTKRILKHCLGLSNKQYKELTDKYPRKQNLGFSNHWVNLHTYFVKVYNQLIDVPIDTLYLPYLYYKYVNDIRGIKPEGHVFISDIIIGIAELKEKGGLK
nr:MAG TPA: hypothetical protein [Caudoviricetes sp.]